MEKETLEPRTPRSLFGLLWRLLMLRDDAPSRQDVAKKDDSVREPKRGSGVAA